MMNKPIFVLKGVALALALTQAGPAAQAQSRPAIGDVLQQLPAPAPASPPPVLPTLGGTAPAPASTVAATGPAVPVRAIVIEGNEAIATAPLAALVADGVGRTLTLPEIEALAQRLTAHYRRQGFLVARAYVPAQDVTAGTLRIRVLEGRYGQFKLRNASRVHDAPVLAMLDRARRSVAVAGPALERSLLLLADSPGLQVAQVDLQPGQAVGSADVALALTAAPRLDGYLLGDNAGSRYTGRNRLSFNLNLNSPGGRGDRLTLGGMASTTGELVNGRLAYGAWLGADGLRGELAASRTQYQLGDQYRELDARGTAQGLDASLSYPLRLERSRRLDASLALAYKDLEDRIDAAGTRSPKTLAVVTAALALRDDTPLLGQPGQTQAQLALGVGQVRLDDAVSRALDAAGPQVAGGFQKLTVSLSRVNRLPGAFTVSATLRHQQALRHKNLDASEYMAVTGQGGVMAYPSGELLNSNATLARLELARALPDWGALRSSWQLFGDWGRASAAHAAGTAAGARQLSDAGAGWSASYRDAFLRLTLAHRLQAAPPHSEAAARTRLLFQAGWLF